MGNDKQPKVHFDLLCVGLRFVALVLNDYMKRGIAPSIEISWGSEDSLSENLLWCGCFCWKSKLQGGGGRCAGKINLCT